MKDYPRIVFFGSPEFAVTSLRKIIETGYSVVTVVTAPDKHAGRGLKVHVSPVKKYACLAGIPFLQPVNLRDPEFLEQLSDYRPDLQVIVAFRMLPEKVWSLPPLGTINLHASLLPQYRGAAPINWTIIRGEKETGLTTFFLDAHMDTGKILLKSVTQIKEGETAGELHDRLMKIGAGLMIRTIEGILSGTVKEIPQEILTADSGPLKPAPKITREICKINWRNDIHEIYNLIRGLSPYPGAFTELVAPDGTKRILKIFSSSTEYDSNVPFPGTFVSDGKSFCKVSGLNGYINFLQVQIEGRKPMQIADFLRGLGWVII